MSQSPGDSEGGGHRELDQAWPVAAKIAVAYAVVSAAWIIFSDRLLLWVFQPETTAQLTRLQHFKAVFFVSVTAVLLFGWIWRSLAARLAVEQEVRALNEQLEERVRQRTAELKQANEQLEAFTYSISHDFRQSLSSIGESARTIVDHPGSPTPVCDAARRIVALSLRIDRMTDELLDYSRVTGETPQLQRVNVELLVNQILGQMQPTIERTGAQVQVVEPLDPMMAHRPALSIAIGNLLSNAFQFIPPGGKPVVRIFSRRKNGRTRLIIEDNGIGIDPRDQARLFHPFQRLAPDYPGTGLGLTIVRRAVERMGGSVGVESTPGQGSMFWIELPLAE